MVRIEDLLSPAKNISQRMIDKQILTVKKAYELLAEYPKRARTRGTERRWEIYKRLRGVMLADEVGMGKTYEALALATRMYLERTKGRRNKFRVLVLASPAIQSKWEWCSIGAIPESDKKRGHLRGDSLCRSVCCGYDHCNRSGPDRHDVGTFLKGLRIKRRKEDVERLWSSLYWHRIKSKHDWRDPEHRHPGNQSVFLAGIQTLPKPVSPQHGGKNRTVAFKRSGSDSFPLEGGFFDLIIADEAHIARTGFEIESEGRISRMALRKLRALLTHSPKAHILLLTATPFQNRSDEFKRLLELLEYGGAPSKWPYSGKTVIRCIKEGLDKSEELCTQLVDNLKINRNAIRQLYREVDLDFDEDPETNYRPKELTIRAKRIIEGLDDYLRDVITRCHKERIEPEIVPVNICANQKAVLHYLLSRDLVSRDEDKEGGETLFHSVTLSELASSEGAFSQSFRSRSRKTKIAALSHVFREDNIFGLKEQALIDLLQKLQNNPRDNQKPVITVFFRFLKSIDSLEKRLAHEGFTYWRFTGKDPKVPLRKNRIEEIQRSISNIDFGVLLVSQVGNEGLDFDSFSNTIIHFDGHYNPAVMDQRNGRVYRNKNKAKDIRTYRLQVQNTYDEKITDIETEKRKMKDFYLGDKTLGRLISEIVEEDLSSKEMRTIWKEFSVNLEPKMVHLLRKYA